MLREQTRLLTQQVLADRNHLDEIADELKAIEQTIPEHLKTTRAKKRRK
jgi:hypothetical protein